MSNIEFKFTVEAYVLPLLCLLGLVGNAMSVIVLSHKDSKLKKDFASILIGLATVDIVFLICSFFVFCLPHLSENYSDFYHHLVVPYLLPVTQSFLMASVYLTAAVSMERYLDTCRVGEVFVLQKGSLVIFLIIVGSFLFNLPRYFEFNVKYVPRVMNVTINEETGDRIIIPPNSNISDYDDTNVTQIQIFYPELFPSDMRLSKYYVNGYILALNLIVMVILPATSMLTFYCMILRKMKEQEATLTNEEHSNIRRARNRSAFRMMLGIIILFLVCHSGKNFVTIYEVYLRIVGSASGKSLEFAPWVKNLSVINHILIILNSSLNFLVYCRDELIRRLLAQWCQKASCRRHYCNNNITNGNLSSFPRNRGGNQRNGQGMQNGQNEAVILFQEMDEQSKLMCGLSSHSSQVDANSTTNGAKNNQNNSKGNGVGPVHL